VSRFAFFAPDPAVADAVETVWDIDLPEARSARAMTFRVLPAISPTVCVHYRAAAASNQPVNPGALRQRVTGVQTGAVTLRPSGPVGAVIIHLKPDAAFRLADGQMDAFTDANVGLSDLCSPTEVSLLEEMLAESAGAAQRAQCVQDFLFRHLRNRATDAVVRQAVAELRRTPELTVRRLASRLDISDRQLARRFRAMTGIGVKRFARVARFGKAIAARRQGRGWAETALVCGFNDQAHMIHEFQAMAGCSPEALVRTDPQYSDLNSSLATSGFYNTLVT
jgi:AraC-like DNA-binding protein